MLEWRYLPNISAAAQAAPSMPGIYAFGEVERVENLPVRINWVYIGKAQNLKKRLSQHVPPKEINPHLRNWLISTSANFEVWYACVEIVLLDELERKLVNILEPDFNQVLYKGENHNEDEG